MTDILSQSESAKEILAKPLAELGMLFVFHNCRILADSGEGYTTERECLADIDRVKASKDAPVKQED